jgi:hypothetical protein
MRLATTGALAAAAALVFTAAAPAKASEPDIVFDAGLACEFALGVTISGGDHRATNEFFDKDGNLVRTIDAGKGSDLLFTNMTTDASLALKGNGAVSRTIDEGDGSTSQLTGHWIWIAFPGDTPPGPSTTLYVGRISIAHGAAGDVLTSATGRSVDICAALE